jgi:hypothetical protein
MNKRILKLAKQSGMRSPDLFKLTVSHMSTDTLEKFAELIVRECKENFAKVWYEQGVDCRGAELDKFMTRFDQHFGVKE